jgi:hypothetical protein
MTQLKKFFKFIVGSLITVILISVLLSSVSEKASSSDARIMLNRYKLQTTSATGYSLNAYRPGHLRPVYMLKTNTNDLDQRWTQSIRNDGWYNFRPAGNQGVCLNAHDNWNGANVFLYNCNDNDPDQAWQFVTLYPDDVVGLLRKPGTNFCLNAHYLSDGGKVNLWQCNNSDVDQQWQISSP